MKVESLLGEDRMNQVGKFFNKIYKYSSVSLIVVYFNKSTEVTSFRKLGGILIFFYPQSHLIVTDVRLIN